jgi:hypothetical protein
MGHLLGNLTDLYQVVPYDTKWDYNLMGGSPVGEGVLRKGFKVDDGIVLPGTPPIIENQVISATSSTLLK